jgi:hypothetical protein
MSDLLNPKYEAFFQAYARGPHAGHCAAATTPLIGICKKQWSKVVNGGRKWSGDAQRLARAAIAASKTVVKSGREWSEVVRRRRAPRRAPRSQFPKNSDQKWS